MKRFCCSLIVMFTTSVSTMEAQAQATQKKLIEFGWDEPDTRFLLRQQAQIERAPFDGCVFHVDAQDPAGKPKGSLTWESWGTRKFTEQELSSARNDLEQVAARAQRPSAHFLRFNTTPAKIDWFDDHSAVIHNARMAARLARQGRCAGILFDTEQYEGQLFHYAKQRDAAKRSFDDYARQARVRGAEIMNAFQDEFPDLKVLLTFGHSYPWDQMQRSERKRALAEVPDGILAPFLDGMIAAARGQAKIIDGYELSYSFRDRDAFVRARDVITRDVRPIVADFEKYRASVSVGFGLWLDYQWRERGWNEVDPTRNYFSPERFAQSLRHAIELSDEYIWVYTEQPRWWTIEGKTAKLPDAYSTVVRRRGQP